MQFILSVFLPVCRSPIQIQHLPASTSASTLAMRRLRFCLSLMRQYFLQLDSSMMRTYNTGVPNRFFRDVSS